MAEAMPFPDSVEEFMESYKVVDTEHIYTNGTEFVPIFRMKQWFEHEPEIIRCKDCKWSDWYTAVDGKRYCYCMETGNGGRTENDFCSRAERREE